ncbi:hypothetical protein SAMN05421734_101431 [Pelagirhabdus alkalitolerans]|uniref:Uncharacterized protein n=1 Tax=Pelagirhabdus alkalitolerans TaxID=1612202 RepID=A0A1G6GRI3_9BACI|nr:hypothetical protein [Pelagirhabdus alkalitolerans]SDB84551.1 hypothetical protein SAMN05421734_101431 [Pelagirhabdus alkalitolerans]
MVSVSQRISKVKQPRGGYIKPKEFVVTHLQDDFDLYENENIHSPLIGLAVDYLTRFINGATLQEAFEISMLGASRIRKDALANELLSNIKGTDDNSIINACKLVGFDVVFRSGAMGYKQVELINPDLETISNIRVMVKRSLSFFDAYGPIVKDGFNFEGGYTKVISKGDGDFLTKDTLWDFKVSKSKPKNKHTLQLFIYYLLGMHSVHPEFEEIKNLGVFNPRLNTVYLLPVDSIPDEVIEEVETTVIGY